MALSDKPGPSPWLAFTLSVAVTVGGLVWGLSSRDSDLRHETAARVALEQRVKTLEDFRGDVREVLADLKAEMRGMRKEMGELTQLIRGKTRLTQDE